MIYTDVNPYTNRIGQSQEDAHNHHHQSSAHTQHPPTKQSPHQHCTGTIFGIHSPLVLQLYHEHL
jgi:hypothetical protein